MILRKACITANRIYDKFIDGAKCMRTLGWEECYIDNGVILYVEELEECKSKLKFFNRV